MGDGCVDLIKRALALALALALHLQGVHVCRPGMVHIGDLLSLSLKEYIPFVVYGEGPL